jgi:hypothetical protein
VYVVFGAGPISIDAAISKGLRNGALPFADRAFWPKPYQVGSVAVQGRIASLACVRDRRVGAFELIPGRVVRVAKQTRRMVVAALLALGLATPLVSSALAPRPAPSRHRSPGF